MKQTINIEAQKSQARAAGMAKATAGRARAFGTGKRPKTDDGDEQIAEALEDEDTEDNS